MPQQCPADATVSFPVGIGGAWTLSYDRTTNVPLNYSFTWGSGTDIPEFSQAASVQSGELNHSSFNSTRLKDLDSDLTYFLASVQLTSPTHVKWLALSTTDVLHTDNQEDIILTFAREPIEGKSQYIILVNPVIRINVPLISSSFLEAFANQTNINVSPDTLFQNIRENTYAYYTTCTKGLTAGNNYENATVVINTKGIYVWSRFMDLIKSKYTTTHGNISYPSYRTIFYQQFSETPTSITTQTKFNTIVKVSQGYASSIAAPTVKEVPTESYKCVSLNPETDISGGAFYIDPETGTPLQNTLGKRQAEIDNYNASYTATVPYEILKSYTNYFLIGTFTLIFVLVILYVILGFLVGESEMGTGASQLKMTLASILKVPIYVVIAFFCTFIGLFIGIGVAWNNNTPSAPVIQKLSSTPATTSGSPSGSPSH